MKTLAQLWAEKTTPTIKVKDSENGAFWHVVAESGCPGPKEYFAYLHRPSEDYPGLMKLFGDLEFVLIPQPPATKRVYQALLKTGDRYDVSYSTFTCLADAQDELNSVDINRKVLKLIEPGFEVPA